MSRSRVRRSLSGSEEEFITKKELRKKKRKEKLKEDSKETKYKFLKQKEGDEYYEDAEAIGAKRWGVRTSTRKAKRAKRVLDRINRKEYRKSLKKDYD
jgi:hydrogenase maturation factor HypE